MGNCFGKQSSDASFQGAGRTLGASQANAVPSSNNARAAAPPKISSSTQGRTLGKGQSTTDDSQSPRAAAARAAEERLKATQGKGKLGKQLDAQRSQTQTGVLAQTAKDNVAARDADAAQQAQAYN